MKKAPMILASLLALTSLTGCTDATAKLKDSNTVLLSIGKTKITKGEIYSMMFASAGESTAITNATKTISSIEIPVTDDMKTSAQNTVDSYVSMYGDTFTSYLSESGMTQDEYMNDYLIPSLQSEKLTDTYIDAEWDSLMTSYDPVKVTILTFTSEDDANAALSELNDGTSDIATVISDHNSSSTGDAEIVTLSTTSYDSTVLSVARSGSPEDGWTSVPGTSTVGSYYLIRIENNDPSTMKDEVVSTLDQIDDVKTAATTYYFRKYNFHVYDIDLYNAIETTNPECLVQAMADPTPTPSASATATATATSSAAAN
ncbi:MAG: hypothetical protein LKF79_08455 [Solobacterium sp.]|nr:hypothetical protein [Solobacterium sp.]